MLLGGLLTTLVGCGQPKTTTIPIQVPTYNVLAGAHNVRAAGLQEVEAGGVIEIRWRDDSGNHFEQGDMDLWVRQPDKTALLISKFGDRLFWVGSDATHMWSFDVRERPALAAFSRHDRPGAVNTLGMPITASLLMQMMAIVPMPGSLPPDSPDATVGYDETLDAWLLGAPAPGDLVAVTALDRKTGLPRNVALVDRSGRLVLRSEVGRYERLDIPGGLPGAGAMFPTLVDITDPETGDTVKIAARNPTNGENIKDRFFDPAYLMKVHTPEYVEGEPPAGIEVRQRPPVPAP